MARPKSVSFSRKPRPIGEILAVLEAAKQLYLTTGGEDIDLALESLRWTMQAYRAQMAHANMLGENMMPHDPRQQLAWGPNVSPYEARMTSAKISTLVRQREQKMAECRAILEEGAQYAKDEGDKQEAAQHELAPAADQQAEESNAEPAPQAKVQAGVRRETKSERKVPATQAAREVLQTAGV